MLQYVVVCCMCCSVTCLKEIGCTWDASSLQRTATHSEHCNTLHCNTLHFNALQHTATHCHTQQRTATHCSTLQCVAVKNSEKVLPMCCGVLQCVAVKCAVVCCSVLLQRCIVFYVDSNIDKWSAGAATRAHLKFTATHCNTSQRIAPRRLTSVYR